MFVVGHGLLLLLVGVVVEALRLLLDRGAAICPLNSVLRPSRIAAAHTRFLLDKSVALGEFFAQLIFEVRLNLGLCHEWQVVEGGGRDPHLFQLLFCVRLDRKRKLDLGGLLDGLTVRWVER